MLALYFWQNVFRGLLMKSVLLLPVLLLLGFSSSLAQKQFTDPVGGFSYAVAQDWRTKAISGSKYQVVFTAASNKFAPNLNFVSETFYNSTLEYFKTNKSAISKAFAGAIVVNEGSFKTINLGTVFTLTIKRREGGVQLIQNFYIYGQGSGHSKWVATCSRLDTQPSSIDSACLSMVKSLKFAK
jgi:hypothetical protein